MAIELVHWNPRRPLLNVRGVRRIPGPLRVNNFGDLIGPRIVREVLRRGARANDGVGRLLTVGSIMHLSQPGDVIWGSGVNGKVPTLGGSPDLDIRAVRGPLTRQRLLENGVSTVPEVYGDPALLWGLYWPRSTYLGSGTPSRAVTIVPNLHEWDEIRDDPRAVSPQSRLEDVVRAIADSELVVGSSLHGIVLAESFGIPARLVASQVEPTFKYADYYGGTGRMRFEPAATVHEAVQLGGDAPPRWDPEALLAAFPWDLFPTTVGGAVDVSRGRGRRASASSVDDATE